MDSTKVYINPGITQKEKALTYKDFPIHTAKIPKTRWVTIIPDNKK